jgi:hypothetical protein
MVSCRGQMGLSEEQQKQALELRSMTNGGKESLEETETDGASCNPAATGGCCQGNGGFTRASEQQKQALELRSMTNGGKESLEETETDGGACNPAATGGCCQGNGGFTCCHPDLPKEKRDKSIAIEQNPKSCEENGKEGGAGSKKGNSKTCPMPTWFETWERADTYAALAVVAAAAAVFISFRIYKNLN